MIKWERKCVLNYVRAFATETKIGELRLGMGAKKREKSPCNAKNEFFRFAIFNDGFLRVSAVLWLH